MFTKFVVLCSDALENSRLVKKKHTPRFVFASPHKNLSALKFGTAWQILVGEKKKLVERNWWHYFCKININSRYLLFDGGIYFVIHNFAARSIFRSQPQGSDQSAWFSAGPAPIVHHATSADSMQCLQALPVPVVGKLWKSSPFGEERFRPHYGAEVKCRQIYLP